MGSIIDSLVSDRTLEDVQQHTSKGVYGVLDVNRVEGAVSYLAGLMVALPEELRGYAQALGVEWNDLYDVPYDPEVFRLATKSDWNELDIFDQADSDRYLGNVEALCQGLECDAKDLPQSLDKLFYYDANAIEESLRRASGLLDALTVRLKKRLEAVVDMWPRSGEFYVGEMI